MPRESIARRVRRIHALEHATIHILSARFPHRSFIGRSDRKGFVLIGEASPKDILDAANSALHRLQRGEASLAYHPNCGTNLAVTGAATGTAAFLTTLSFRESGWRKRLEQLPTVILTTTVALILSRPLAALAQRHLTTDPDPGNLSVVNVEPLSIRGATAHRVAILDQYE